MPALIIPETFAVTILEVHSQAGRAWLAHLPDLVQRYSAQWSLTLEAPFTPLSYNYVAPARQVDQTDVVFKAGVPNAELTAEIAALRHYAGQGSVRLLAADAAQGVLLLERLRPGTPLADIADDDTATGLAADVMQALWRPAPRPGQDVFPTLARWASGLQRLRERFAGGTGPLPPALVAAAETLFAELLASPEPAVLLHGDLHHWNILAAARGPWLAIDPKGVIGEPAYELGAFLRNRLPPGPPAGPLLSRRAAIFAERLNLDRLRILSWAAAQAVLSAWWSIEDHGGGWEPAAACAEQLLTLI